MRVPAAAITTIVLAMLLFAGNFSLWLDSEVIDSDSFVESTVEALATESSRTAVSQLIVDQMVDEVPLLIILESNLTTMFSELLASSSLGEVITFVAVDVHGRIVTGNQDAVVISLTDYRDVVLGPLEAISPRLADLVPDEWFVSIEILGAGVLPDLSLYERWIGIAKVVAIGGALVLIVGMLWFVRRRGVAVVLIGAAFSLAGVASALLVPGARWLTLRDIDREAVQVVIGNTYVAFTGQLLWSVVVLFTIGVALVMLGVALWADEDATEPTA